MKMKYYVKAKGTQTIQTQLRGVNIYKWGGGGIRNKNFQIFNHDWSNAYAKKLRL
jgi:hypothetical protein